eukprot:6205574-Pleurochrysis_carterae.AAC.4
MYLSHHRSIGLRFEKASRPIEALSDSNWATRHSMSGYVFMYNQAAIFLVFKETTLRRPFGLRDRNHSAIRSDERGGAFARPV